ncbi:MAG: Phosphoglycerate kinase [Patescibacteria group bacterium]|nr:Phosphoglycerate kinase [Patescibacteria group bacterium]
MKTLKDFDLKGKKVLYRPDYNVPLKDGQIQDPFRIEATYPTLDYLIDSGAKIIIATHLGRPDGKKVKELETRVVAEYLAEHYLDSTVRLAHEIKAPEVDAALEEMEEGDILILPNLRFSQEEEGNGQKFAEELASLAEIYVNDAFACDHRAHASIVGVPAILPGAPGFLLENELEHLGSLIKNPESPFVVIMGGAKVSDKIEVIKTLAAKADTILIGGAMANTFLLAKGEDIGKSKAEADKVDVAKALMEEFGDKLVIAPDYVKDVDTADFRYLDIGEESVELFKKYLSKAKTIFWNGSLGYTEEEAYAKASQAIAEYVAGLKKATSIVAGGDTVEMITRLDLYDKFTFISTGGGAALEFLAGEELPGVKALENK